MIEAKDLMMSNKVLWNRHYEKLDNEIVEIYNIQRSSIRVYTDIEELSEVLLRYEDIEGIPLTEEWLIKFGFEKEDNGVGFKADIFTMIIMSSDFYFRPSYRGGFYWGFDRDKQHELEDVQPIEHLHQLQNLYFALTGETLKIKE